MCHCGTNAERSSLHIPFLEREEDRGKLEKIKHNIEVTCKTYGFYLPTLSIVCFHAFHTALHSHPEKYDEFEELHGLNMVRRQKCIQANIVLNKKNTFYSAHFSFTALIWNYYFFSYLFKFRIRDNY